MSHVLSPHVTVPSESDVHIYSYYELLQIVPRVLIDHLLIVL